MAAAADGDGDGEPNRFSVLDKALKEGERILAPTRRPDGTLRKPIRIRAGYVPQDEVAIYQSKGAILKKSASQEVPPGYDLVADAKPKTKAAKRNDRKKEKRQQAALAALASEKGKLADEMINGEVEKAQNASIATQSVESLQQELDDLTVSDIPNDAEDSLHSNSENIIPDLDKKIRALKKKIRLTEALQNGQLENLKPEQLEKLSKLDDWREELKHLEDQRGIIT